MRPTDRIFLFKPCHRRLSEPDLIVLKNRISQGEYTIDSERLSYFLAKELRWQLQQKAWCLKKT